MHFDLHPDGPDSYRTESKKIKEKKIKTGGGFFFSNKYTNLKMHINSHYEFSIFVILRTF